MVHVVGGRVVQGGSIPLATGGTIRKVEYGETLGMSQLLGINLGKTKKRVMAELYKKMRHTWNSDLYSMKTSNTWVAVVLRFFLGILKWLRRDLLARDRKVRQIMHPNKAHHAGASIERLYLPRIGGGRGLQSVELLWEYEIVGVAKYLLTSEELQIKGAMSLQKALSDMGYFSYIEEAWKVLSKYEIEMELTSSHPNAEKQILMAQQEALKQG